MFRFLTVNTALAIYKTASVRENYKVFRLCPLLMKYRLTVFVSISVYYSLDIDSEDREIVF